MPDPTFAVLRQLLLDLGFQTKVATKTSVLLEHEATGATVVFPPFADHEAVDPATLVVVGRTLDEKGVLDRQQFQEQLRERSLAG